MARVRAKIGFKEVDKGWNKIRALAKAIKDQKAYAKVGVLDNGGKGSENRGAFTQAALALLMEYGSDDGRIPARSWVGSTFERKKAELTADAAVLFRKILEGRLTVDRALGLLGAKLATEIKKGVTSGPQIPPPNAPATLKKKEKLTRKGASRAARTLIDTGRMVASVTWAVISKGA